MNIDRFRENYESLSPDPDFLPVRITHHRCVESDYTVRLTIELGNGRRIILSEREVQATYPDIVYRYWRMFPGGRCSATGYDMFHPFHIIRHRKSQGAQSTEYEVQWVGYSKKQTTWEKGEDLAIWSAELKDGYDEANGLRN